MQCLRLKDFAPRMGRKLHPSRIFRLPRLVSWLAIGLLSLMVTTGWVTPALGQLSLPNPTPQALTNRPPNGVERYGAIEVTTVQFDGEPLIKIAAPTVRDRSNPGNVMPVEERANQIEATLNRVIEDDVSISPEGINAKTNYDLESLEVYPSTLNNETVLFVKDKNHPEPLKILSVTQADANFYGFPINAVAELMQSEIGSRLREALKERTTETIEQQLGKVLPILLGMVCASLVLLVIQRLLRIRDQVLRNRQHAEAAETIPPPDQATSQEHLATQSLFREAFKRQFTLKRRRSVIAFFRWLAFWGYVVIWIGGTSQILGLFPWTRQFSLKILSIPLKLLLVWFITGLLIHLGDVLLDYLAKVWNDSDLLTHGYERRESLRISTVIGVLRGLKNFLIYVIGITWALSFIGLPVASVLAIGGIIAFAISLGFQNVVKDVVNGFLILLEDQFAVGDVVAIEEDSGLVENMNLRITQLRDGEGQLITIPNSAITQVRNLTRTWSRVDFSIEVAYETDINFALDVLREVAQTMYDESEWRNRFFAPPEVLGVDDVSHYGMLLRVWIQTSPGQQWAVGREFRRRVRVAFDQRKIAIGKPQRDLWYREQPSANGSGSSSDKQKHPAKTAQPMDSKG